MAFDPNNPPSLIASGIGGSRGLKAWAWKGSDPIADVIATGYIRTARKLGMGVGDSVRYVDLDNAPHHLTVASIDADTGWGTVSFPATSEEAFAIDPSPSGEIYIVAYVDGVPVRIDPTDLPVGTLTYASQAEAEAGTAEDKPLNALRGFQAIAAYIAGRAAKTTPVDADAIVITDSAAAGAPKQVTWANIKATMFTAWGMLLAAATAKTTPVDADVMLLSDSAASSATKKVTWANVKATVLAALGTTIAALTGKTTPVDADTLAISDSAASGAGKSLTWANLKATLKTYFDTLYKPLTPTSFSAHKNNTNQTGILEATYTQVTFSTEDWDDGAAFASSAWTPPAGKYVISATAYSTANIVDQSLHILALYKNGVIFKYIDLRSASGTGAVLLTGRAVVQASGSDVFTLWYYGAGTGAKTISGASADTYFQGASI